MDNYEEVKDAILGVTLYNLGERRGFEVAEDMASDVMVQLLENGTIEELSNSKALHYARRAAKWSCIDIYRNEGAKRRSNYAECSVEELGEKHEETGEGFNLEAMVWEGLSPEEEVIEREEAELVVSLVLGLTRKQKEVVELAFSGYSTNEIAETLDIPYNTAQKRIRRVCDTLRDKGVEWTA